MQQLECVLEIEIVYSLYNKYWFGMELLVDIAIYSLEICTADAAFTDFKKQLSFCWIFNQNVCFSAHITAS